jgi:hypothetical protein
MSAPFTEFTLFPLLPTEIRLKIWSLAFQYARLIEIRTLDHPSNIVYTSNALGNKVSDIEWETRSAPPAALSVCQESRQEALRVWRIKFVPASYSMFSGSGGGGGGGGGDRRTGVEVQRPIYINPVLDTIYINLKWAELLPILLDDIRAFDDVDGRGSQSLALNIGFFCGNSHFVLSNEARFIGPELQRLTLVVEDGESYWAEWDRSCAFVAPATTQEMQDWETWGRRARGLLDQEMQARGKNGPELKIVAIRRGDEARTLDDEDKEHCILQEPMRPNPDFDPMPDIVPSWN